MPKISINRKLKKVKNASQSLMSALQEVTAKLQPFIDFEIEARVIPGDGVLIGVLDQTIYNYEILLIPPSQMIAVINKNGRYTEEDIFAI